MPEPEQQPPQEPVSAGEETPVPAGDLHTAHDQFAHGISSLEAKLRLANIRHVVQLDFASDITRDSLSHDGVLWTLSGQGWCLNLGLSPTEVAMDGEWSPARDALVRALMSMIKDGFLGGSGL